MPQTSPLIEVVDEPMGGALALDAAVSDVTLTVESDSTIDFSEAGGLLRLNGVEYGYESFDKDTGVAQLTSALTVAGVAGDPVDAMSEPGLQAHEWTALLEPHDPDGEPIPASIPVELVGYFTIAEPGVRVQYVEDGPSTYRVLTRPETEPSLDGAGVWNPYVGRRATTTACAAGAWTTLTGWTDEVSQGVTIEPDGSVTITHPGFYPIDVAPTFSGLSTSGSRYAQILVNGVVVGYLGIPADSAGDTDVPVSARRVLAVGDNVTVQARQTSGGGLDVKGGVGISPMSLYRTSI